MCRLRRTGRAIRCPHILRCNNQYMYKIRGQRLIPSSTSSLDTAILHQPRLSLRETIFGTDEVMASFWNVLSFWVCDPRVWLVGFRQILRLARRMTDRYVKMR